jgi:hypothetical protein
MPYAVIEAKDEFGRVYLTAVALVAWDDSYIGA